MPHSAPRLIARKTLQISQKKGRGSSSAASAKKARKPAMAPGYPFVLEKLKSAASAKKARKDKFPSIVELAHAFSRDLDAPLVVTPPPKPDPVKAPDAAEVQAQAQEQKLASSMSSLSLSKQATVLSILPEPPSMSSEGQEATIGAPLARRFVFTLSAGPLDQEAESEPEPDSPVRPPLKWESRGHLSRLMSSVPRVPPVTPPSKISQGQKTAPNAPLRKRTLPSLSGHSNSPARTLAFPGASLNLYDRIKACRATNKTKDTKPRVALRSPSPQY